MQFSGTSGAVSGTGGTVLLSATDTLGWWISIRNMPKDVGMPLYPVLVTAPRHVCAWG